MSSGTMRPSGKLRRMPGLAVILSKLETSGMQAAQFGCHDFVHSPAGRGCQFSMPLIQACFQVLLLIWWNMHTL